MIDLDEEPTELSPAWASQVPPRYDLIRAGVRYDDLELDVVVPLLAQTDIRMVQAAMGPACFWGREDGPFVPYDVKVKDQNENRAVQDRVFPWSFGDVVWVSGIWEGMPTAVRLHKLEGCDLYCAVGTGRVQVGDMTAAVDRRVSSTTKLRAILKPGPFLREARSAARALVDPR